MIQRKSRVECKIEGPLESNEKKFITSPADIDIHRKVDLQDAEITETIRKLLESYVMNTRIYFLQILVT